jgi:HAD superfamily hydrolase (TIGR01493 family)
MPPVLAPIDAIVFDAYGTLFDVNSAAARWREALGPQAEAFSATWRRKQLEYSWLRSLMGAHADFLAGDDGGARLCVRTACDRGRIAAAAAS